MRLRHPDGTVVHLGYGTNVLPAEDVDGLVRQVSTYGDRLRRHLDTDRVGLGMWLPAAAARRLAADLGEVERLREAIDAHGVEMVTLNAFPYASFQDEVVKKRVYHPTWAEQARLDYTLDVARVLAALLPDDASRGSISTLPLAWRAPWLADRQAHAELHLKTLAEGLAEIEADTGRTIRVAFEPEPGCVIETIAEAVDRLDSADRERIGVCLDLCHLAVGFEDATDALARLDAAGLDVVKVQPGCRPRRGRPGRPGGPRCAVGVLRGPLPAPGPSAGGQPPRLARRPPRRARRPSAHGRPVAVAGALPRARPRRPRAAAAQQP